MFQIHKSVPLMGLIFSALATEILAENRTWGWTAPPDAAVAQPVLQLVWSNDDGAAGHILVMAGAQTYMLDSVTDPAKAIVISGEISVDDASLGQHAFAALPASPDRSVSCVADDGCVVYLEAEPSGAMTEMNVVAATDIPWFDVPNTGGFVSLAWVWGEAETAAPSSFFLRFQPGFPGFQHAHTHGYHGIVLQGAYTHWEPADDAPTELGAGATFWQAGVAAHDDACGAGDECIAYFRIDDAFDVFPAE